MRHLFLSVTAALALAGCAADRQDADSSSTAPRSTAAPQTFRTTPLAAATRHATFASLPDHGALLAYTPGRETIQRGAETYRAVQLSESHALNAAAKGRAIELPTPSGETVRIAFQRIEEGLDGNWSWIGRTADGQDAVITFGEKAVFGRIGQRGTEALRLTTAGGRAWLVETDPSRVIDGNRMPGARDHDMLVPPATAAAALASKRTAAAPTTFDAKASPAQTVDVVVGYTNGLVSKLGSASAAETRVANLVALSNQAYANSQVTPRIRLVKTLQVAYTDTNSNEMALEAVTGVTCTTTSCSPQTVPAELAPLRTARDQYGGDLVALLRPLKSPEQGGCGIAWLLGGGGFPIDNTDADFGYSVVSDGTDVDETDGRTYSCVDTAFAHELGHNMGQQHNVEDSGGDSGTHSYSYGYRESTSTGFYTVMAYRLANSSQFNIGYFGNPSVTYADTGRPTGTANANNAASLNISMPLVAQFRTPVVPFGNAIIGDLDGDGRSDLRWRFTSTGAFATWLMNGATVTSTRTVTPVAPSAYSIVGMGDFDGDGRTDILWTSASRDLWLWRSLATDFSSSFVDSYPVGWDPVGVGDANGDGRADILWRNSGTGAFAYWQMNGSSVTRIVNIAAAAPSSYRLVAARDINGDGRVDPLWANDTIRDIWVWQSGNNDSYTPRQLESYPAGWQAVDAGDMDADGDADILWRGPNGEFVWWVMNNGAVQRYGTTNLVAPPAYSIASIGDYNGDGYLDIVWTSSARDLWMWTGSSSSLSASFVGSYPSGWTVVR